MAGEISQIEVEADKYVADLNALFAKVAVCSFTRDTQGFLVSVFWSSGGLLHVSPSLYGTVGVIQ